MKKIVNYFFQGLLFIAPLAVTGYIIFVGFNFIDGLLQNALEGFLEKTYPGLGVLILILTLVLVGFLGQTIIAQPLKMLFKNILNRVPLLKVIYSALNDLFSAFVGKDKKFNQPVLVLVNPVSNLEKLGFLTEENLTLIDEKDKVAVYFPHSYNFSGELFIVPRNQVRSININPGEVMKFIVSAGVAGWDKNDG